MREEKVASIDDVRRQNTHRIVSTLRLHGSLSRTELAHETRLSPSTVTMITSELLERGIVIAARKHPSKGTIPSRRGRPRVALSLAPGAYTIGLVEITLHRVSVTIADYTGNRLITRETSVDVGSVAPDDWPGFLADRLDEATADLDRASRAPMIRLAIGLEGMTDAQGRSIYWSPLTPYRNIPLAGPLEARLGVSVSVDNEAALIATALQRRFPQRYSQSLASVLLGYGVGMGLILDGEGFNGAVSSAAEFGHMCHEFGGALCRCGRRGCVEAYAGEYAVLRAASGRPPQSLPGNYVNHDVMEKLADTARQSDGPERAAFARAGLAIGTALRNLFALIDPVPVAFVSFARNHFDLLEPTLREALGRRGVGLSHADIAIDWYDDAAQLFAEGLQSSALQRVDLAVSRIGTGHAHRLTDTLETIR